MFNKRKVFVFGLVFLFMLSMVINIQAAQIPRETWPESWFGAHPGASEMGITDFHQSPILDEAVANGELPPVEERLSKDPIVIEPVDEIGKYGGTAVTFSTTNTALGEADILNHVEGLAIADPEAKGIVPAYAKKWEFDEDGKELTIYIREGIKWSDGHPFTADDYIFWWEHHANNDELSPVPPERWSPTGISDVIKIDDYTIKFVFTEPRPLVMNGWANGPDRWVMPAHHMKNYHIDFVSEDKLMEEIEDKGFDTWVEYYWYGTSMMDPDVRCPTLRSYVLESSSQSLVVMKRNPYYPKVDPEGNQLPYIDKIQIQVVQDQEMMTAKAATGQATFAGIQLLTSDIPLFKKAESQGELKTLIWNRLYGNDVAIQPNLNHQDEKIRKVMQDIRFRKALALSIDREAINKTVYFGMGTPRAATVMPNSSYFEPEFATKYHEYKPEQAKKLLDEMGLKDNNGDGWRDFPDGKPFTITLEWTPMETPKADVMEIVLDNWHDIGINIKLKQISGSLQSQRARAGLMDMTLWHVAFATDFLFPIHPWWWTPIRHQWEMCQWNEWVDWCINEGEEGEEPPQEVKNLYKWYKIMNTTMDEEERIKAGKNILASNAENIWEIGTIGIAPQPIVIATNLKNVPEKGYWGWDNRWGPPYHPETWYLEE